MSKNPFQKYLEATDRQNTNYSYLRAGTPSLGAEYADTTLQPQYTDKTLNDYIGDTAVDATKAAMTLAQTGISTIDAGAYAAEGLIGLARGIGSTVAPNYVAPPDIQEYGQFSKLLNDNLGFNIGKAKQQLGELGYSDIRKKQEAELHTGYSEKEIQDFKDQWTIDFYLQYQDLANKGANPLELEAFKSKFEDNYKQAYAQMMDKYQTSWDKSLSENIGIIGKAFGTVLDNPSLGVGAAIESTGYLPPSFLVSRGVAALQGAARAATATERAIAAGIGEGLVSALALNEQMRGNSATGTIDGTKVAAGFAGGGITALIGGVSNRLGSRFGLDDIDSLGTQAKGFSVTKPVLATAQEGGEEFLQGFGESIIPNIAEGKDPLQGLAQELALGTAAGGVMGAATNARSLVSGAGGDLVAGFNKVAEAVGKGKDAITAKTFEELNDPTNKAYDPAKAFNSVVPKLNSQDDRDREEALVNIEKVFTNLETHTSNLNTEKVTAEGILKNIAALPIEEQAQHAQAKNQAQKAIKELEQRIASADKQYMDLFEQKLTLSKNQEVQAGVPQYSEEQAKADIEVLSQQPTTAVWRNQDTDLPVSVLDETQVDEAGQEYTKVSYTDAATGNVSENFVPSSELVQDITTQQEAAERVTKHFSKLSLDELDTVAKSPYLSEEQRNSLRYLSETKRAIADMADTGTVTRHILNGLKGKTAAESHRGLNNYTEMVNTAINTKDEKLLNIALDDLGRFAQDHTDKANALVEAYQLAVSGKFPNLQVLRPKNGTWGIVTDPNKFVDDVKLKATGGLNVHRNSNIKGSIDAVTKEAALIQDSLKALTQVGLSFGLQAVEPAVTPPVTVEALREANKPSSANAVNSTYEQVQVPPTNTALSTYVNHSGGALGSDSAWGDIGAVYGVTSNHYYKDKTPKGNVQITKEQYEEGLLKAKEAAKALGRNWSSKSYIQGLLARNWQQVKNADAIFAIAELEGKYVKGGTGYAVAMAVAENKPIYVFSQSKKSWFRHTGTGWVKTNTPTLTTNFAGIGTRELDAVGVQAIKDVYAKTQQDNKSVTAPVSGSNTQATKPTPNQEVNTPTPKVGETSIEVKGRFTITKTVVSDNTVLSVHTDNDNGEVTKSEYATTYSDIYSDELGDKYTLVIYRDSTNPSVITDVKSFDPKDKKNSIGSYGKQGNQTDEKFITTFTEARDVTLKYSDKFEKPLPVIKPKIPNASTQTEPTVTPPVTVETLREANKPVVTNSDTTDITSTITRLNKYNKAGTPLTIDNVTPEVLQTIQTRVFNAFELGIVNQQTYDGVTKDIAALQQYLNNSKLNTPNQEVNTPTTSTQTEPTEAVSTEPQLDTSVVIEATKQVAEKPKPLKKSVHNTELDSTVNKGIKGYVPIKIPNVFGEYGIYYAKPVTIKGSGDFKFYVYKSSDGTYRIVEFATGVTVTDFRAEGSISSAVAQLTKDIAENGLKSFEALYTTRNILNTLEPQLGTATPTDTVSIDKLEATVKSFVKVRDITSEEYKQDTATVYEKQWFKVKTAYNNTVRRLVELVSKGVTTVEDVAALTDILNKLYEFAAQTIDLNSDRAAIVKLTQRIDSLATVLFSDVSPEIIDAYLKGKTESIERRGSKLTTDRDGAKSFDGRTIEYVFNAPHLQETKTTTPLEAATVKDTTSDTIIEVQAASGLVHRIASKLVNKLLTVKFELDNILDITSDALNEKQAAYVSGMLKTLIGLNPSVRAAFYSDLEQVQNAEIKALLPKSKAYTRNNIIYVDLKNDKKTDIREMLLHEYHHTVTAATLETLDPSSDIHKALAEVDTAIQDFLSTSPNISAHVLSRLKYMSLNFKELMTVGVTEPRVIARLRTIMVNDTQSAYDVIWEQSIAVLKLQNHKLFTPEVENTLNDLAQIGRGDTPGVSNSSTQSTDTPTGTSENNESQDTGGDTTTASVPGASNTGADTEQTTNQAEVEDGKITVLQGVTEEVRQKERSQPFSVRNLIKAYFTQKKGDASNSSLVLVKDFISNVNVVSELSKYLSIDTKVNTKQKAQVEHFQKFAKNLAPVITRVFQGEFSKDPKNNLVRDLAVDGVLDENILTAIAVAAYGYLIRYSEPYNTDDSIRDIVRLSKDDAIPPEVAQLLRYAGQEAPYIEIELGQQIAQLLGLKALDDASADLQSRLEKSFGSLATAALNDVGYVSVDETSIKPKAIGYLMRNAGYTGNEASGIDDGLEGTENLHALETLGKLTFIRVNYKVDDNAPVIAINKAENIDPVKVLRPARNKDGLIIIKPLVWGTDLNKTSPNDLNDILKNSEETKGILDRVFNNDVGYTKPLMVEPEALDAKTKQGTNSSISKTQKELVEKGQKTAFSIRANTVNVLRTLKGLTDDSKLLKQLLGIWVDDTVKARTHVTDRESLEAKANNEWRTLTNGLEWADITSLGNDEYAEFYDAQYITQNERMQYLSNLFNMQGSQIHRAMASLSAFKLEIDLTDTSSANENLQRFYQAVGEGLEGLDKYLSDDIKSRSSLLQFFTTDKVKGEVYTEALQRYFARDPNVSRAIAAMESVLRGNVPTVEQQADIALFVERGDMGIQSLQSLIALGEMQVAKVDGKNSFTTTIGLGSDGVNNGVATANILTGVITREMKQQVGMLPKKSTKYDPVPSANMQEVYAEGKPDYYISFGAVMGRFLGLLRETDTDKNKQWRDSVQALFPLYKAIQEASLEMRKIAKTWSIPFNYGAGKKSLQRALARGFMAGIYKDMNKIANKAIDLNTALAEKDITKEMFDVEMAALRLTAVTLQENINNILKRWWSEAKDSSNKPIWKTKYRIQFPKDLTKLNDYNFDQAQVGQLSYGTVFFGSDVATDVSKDIVYSLTQAVTALHGQAAWQATEEYAQQYTRVRDLLNTVHTATYMLYENMRTDLTQAKLREKREKIIGTIEKRNAEMEASNNALINEYRQKGKEAVRKAQADPRWQVTTPVKDLVKEFEYLGLTTEELREVDNILKPVAPVLHSALSRETNDLNSGITLAATENRVGKASDNKQVATTYVDKHKGKPRYNTSGLTFKAEITSGIKALAMAVQGVDAYVAAYLQAKFPTLNVHDAGIFGLKYFVEATKYQNEIYLQAMVNYHLNTESIEALMRSYLGLKDFVASLDSLGLDEIAKAKFIKQVEIVEDNILNRVAERNPDGTVKTRLYIDEDGGSHGEEIRKGIFKGLNQTLKTFGVLPKDNIIEALQVLILIAVRQDMDKLKSLKDLKAVHQYSGEGGAFTIGGKGSDLSEAEHLRRIEAQEELLEVKRRTLLQQLEREGVALDMALGKRTRGSSLLNFLTINKDKEVDVKDIVVILRGDSSLTRSTAEFDRQLAILDGLDGLLDGVKVIYKDVESTGGVTDRVRGFYDSDTNTITLRANAKYPANPVLVLHELLHSGLAARIAYLKSIPEGSKEYAEARKALARLEALRQEVLSKLVAGIDASKYFELKAAFEKAGGWDTYKKVQEKLKEAKNSAYEARNVRIKTLKELRLKAYEELNAQKAELQAAKNLEQKALDGLRASKFNSLEYQTARLQQQAALVAIKEIKQELQQKYENIASINTELDKLYASNITDELNSNDIARVELSKKFLTLHSALKNTLFTIEGGTEITALTMVERLESVDEFISYGLTEQSVQDILQNIDVVNTAERKQVSALKGMWGKFVKAISGLFVRPSAEVVPALSAFILDTADLLRSIRNEDVPRLPVETPTRLFSTSSDGQVNQMSSIEVMQALPHTGNSDFGLHLNSLAETVIGQLYNNDEVAKAQIDVIQGLSVLPATKAGFNLSQREAAVQQALELVLDTYMANTTGGINASQMWKLFKEAQKNIKVENLYDGDWATATPQQRAATQQKFSYLFADNLKGSDALARFVSMALASEEVHNLLGFNTVTAKPSKQKTWFDTFSSWVQYVFAWMGNKLVKTSANDPAYKQLQKLVNNLVALDIRNRQETVALYEKAWNLVGKVTSPLDKAAQTLRQYATNRDFLRNSKYLPLRTLGSIAALDAKAMGETIPKLIRETRDKARPNEKLGEAMNALMESTAMTQIRKAMEALIRQANLNAKERQDRTDNVKKAIMSWFKDGGKHITKEVHKAITYTLLRTDAQSLLTTFGLNKTVGLLLDTNKLKNEIDLVTKDISQYQNGNSLINQAMRLGYYMVTNKGGLGLSKNPTAIAMGLGTNYQIDLEGVDQALVGQLDVLVSLFAMKYTSAKDRKVLGEMYKENPEALEGLLQMHKGFMTDAETEFKDNPLNYVKGWMPEIVNPYREVRAASGISERDQMIKEGWKLIEEIKPHGKFLMIHYDIGYQRLVSGAVDLQNSHRKGTEVVNRTSRNYLYTVRANLAYSAHIASIPHTQFDPSKQETGLIPAYDTDGVPMGFNYEMASWVRDEKMERNNNFADLMGAYAGAMFYKPAKRNQSVTVANVLFEDFKQNYQKNPNSYIKLSGKSSDPKIVEMWRMLPKDFRQRATELYGKGEPIIINNEAFLLAFGFKKWTITSIWDKPADQRTKMETMFVTMAEGILGDTAKARIAKGGHIWAEVVSKAKDFIVIRSIGVLWNNIIANGLMLMAYGINPFTIAKDWAFITANVRSYQKLHSELIQLKANMVAGKGNDALERQIKAIEKQLEANPMNRYINEGLLSSIVEDVTIQQGDYSYDSELKKKIDGVTGWLPDSVKTIGAWAVLSPSTQGYQFLATTTQLSDFVAKVTLAKHLESKGMDFKAAVSEASQTFINYDVPQGVGMQYMNDMGLFMFTKFFLRIQAVLFKLMDKKAATVLAQHIAVESLTDMQGILDPMALARIGNWPFEEGAASIMGAAMSIAPVNAGLGLVGM